MRWLGKRRRIYVLRWVWRERPLTCWPTPVSPRLSLYYFDYQETRRKKTHHNTPHHTDTFQENVEWFLGRMAPTVIQLLNVGCTEIGRRIAKVERSHAVADAIWKICISIYLAKLSIHHQEQQLSQRKPQSHVNQLIDHRDEAKNVWAFFSLSLSCLFFFTSCLIGHDLVHDRRLEMVDCSIRESRAAWHVQPFPTRAFPFHISKREITRLPQPVLLDDSIDSTGARLVDLMAISDHQHHQRSNTCLLVPVHKTSLLFFSRKRGHWCFFFPVYFYYHRVCFFLLFFSRKMRQRRKYVSSFWRKPALRAQLLGPWIFTCGRWKRTV